MKLKKQVTRRQHYVWRNYLSQWTTGKNICCWRDQRSFKAGLMNVAQERDFYKLKELQEADIAILKQMIHESDVSDMLKEVNLRWIEDFQKIFDVRSYLIKKKTPLKSIDTELDSLIISLEEDIHSRLEGAMAPLLRRLLDQDETVFTKDENYTTFCLFIAAQYLRTNNMKQRLHMHEISNLPGFTERSLGVLRAIFSTNIGGALFANRENLKPVFLKNTSNINFITSDQPVVNCCDELDDNDIPTDLEFFYPISPRLAIHIGSSNNVTGETIEVSESQVDNFNKKLIEFSYNQVFALTIEETEHYSQFLPKKNSESIS
ncbi:DUF4238 domain-containing protein [Pseudomonas oryzihabitans]|uniref:DUF4238 domain-containing protein n=1 Tax=Pseudomonas oryzihabitans TaxID=47885 RepID=UPI003CFEE503